MKLDYILPVSILIIITFTSACSIPQRERFVLAPNAPLPKCEYYSQLKCLYYKSVTAFYNRLREDITFAHDKQVALLNLVYYIEINKDKSKFNETNLLVNDVIDRLKYYDGRSDLDIAPFRAASDSYRALVEASAEMKLRIGQMYVNLGEKDKAKQMFRSIIINYTGSAYKPYVKKAEFALEDLK
ncbi:MAG: hypothetical protein WC568_06665 [Candidatus Methanoperedens sp.]